MSVVCAGPDYEGLDNPYTGEPMRVEMTMRANGLEPLFCAPDTFSPATFRTRAEMDRFMATVPDRNKCAWTGRLMRLVELDGEVAYLGGFDPHVPTTRDEFLRQARMRDGVGPGVSTSRVEHVEELPASQSHAVRPIEGVEEVIRDMVDGTPKPRRRRTRR